MSQEELLSETNALLRRWFDMDATRRAEADRRMAELKQKHEDMTSPSAEGRRARLLELGVPDSVMDVSEEGWEARRKTAQDKAMQNAEAARAREERFRDALLAEFQEQSRLLRLIAERLGA